MATFEVISLLALLAVFVWMFAKVGQRTAMEREQEFTGEVVDRRHEEVTLTTGMRHDYWLVVHTDDDRTISWSVKGTVYDTFRTGDRIVKRAGDRWPVKQQSPPPD